MLKTPSANGKPTPTTPSATSPSKVQKYIVSNGREHQQMRLLRAKVQELETLCTGMRGELAALNTKEMQEKLGEVLQTMDKKASILDLKKMYGSLDDTSGRFEDIKKEMAEIHKAIKVLEENEELKSLKLKCASLENKLIASLKNVKDLQTKVTETMTLQIMPQSQQLNEEDKKEDRLSQFVEETNEKVGKMREAMSQFKIDFEALSRALDDKVDSKASKESLVDLESTRGC